MEHHQSLQIPENPFSSKVTRTSGTRNVDTDTLFHFCTTYARSCLHQPLVANWHLKYPEPESDVHQVAQLMPPTAPDPRLCLRLLSPPLPVSRQSMRLHTLPLPLLLPNPSCILNPVTRRYLNPSTLSLRFRPAQRPYLRRRPSVPLSS